MNEALILIDIQKDYFPGGRMELADASAAAEKAAFVLARFRAARKPVVHVRHESIQPGATFLLKGGDGSELHPLVAPLPGETVISKHDHNCFRHTDLMAVLQRFSASRLTICGMMTHMCVDTGVRAAFDLGFHCRLVADACATRDLEHEGRTVAAADVQAAYVAALGAVFARVSTAADIDVLRKWRVRSCPANPFLPASGPH
ncbi:Nicotinamidase-related amidase [Humidesulfovibrio mexicanus]|uniref:Nicotinamidase-related amidase n=1 Tax=Humidesulfovibrio mexicanus TaxID=147047 RepID=A0A238YDC2_9BACT|nr:cysteine hydrolase family protein [Humidesulfovibrio mexicanus]SNR68972.1 Nicotinamidase-related amidase [Humidesulfovibrio mexicanus]